MWKPWGLAPDGTFHELPPDQWTFEPGDWSGVEAALGTELPGDYKGLIGDGLSCVFDDELWVASPFDPNPNLNLIRISSATAWGLAELRRQLAAEVPAAIYPEPGGLLAWGADGGGGQYHWETGDVDPDSWPVAVTGRPVFDPMVQRHPGGLTSYLDGLASGRIQAAALGHWPRPGARLQRRTD